jgi:hypothetical protein
MIVFLKTCLYCIFLDQETQVAEDLHLVIYKYIAEDCLQTKDTSYKFQDSYISS